MLFFSCDGKSEFSASFLQASVSHDPYQSNMMICCSRQLCGNHKLIIIFFFSGFFEEQKVVKNCIYLISKSFVILWQAVLTFNHFNLLVLIFLDTSIYSITSTYSVAISAYSLDKY